MDVSPAVLPIGIVFKLLLAGIISFQTDAALAMFFPHPDKSGSVTRCQWCGAVTGACGVGLATVDEDIASGQGISVLLEPEQQFRSANARGSVDVGETHAVWRDLHKSGRIFDIGAEQGDIGFEGATGVADIQRSGPGFFSSKIAKRFQP